MLDYAADSVAYWPIEHIHGALEQRREEMGLGLGERGRSSLHPSNPPDW